MKRRRYTGLQAWLDHGERGMSSEAIVSQLVERHYQFRFLGDRDRSAHPHDLSDFGRCQELLLAVPQLRRELHLMRRVSPQWDALVMAWDSIEGSLARGDEQIAYDVLRAAIALGDAAPKRKARTARPTDQRQAPAPVRARGAGQEQGCAAGAGSG